MKLINQKGITLDTVLTLPKNAKAGVVLCHGFLSDKSNETHQAIMKNLAKEDIASFAFDLTGHGQSEGNLMGTTFSDFYGDLVCAISSAQSVLPKPIGLYGSSMGGGLALLYAATHGTAALALKCPIVDPVRSWNNYLTYRIEQVPEPTRSALSGYVKGIIAGTPPLYKQVSHLSVPMLVVGALEDNLVDKDDLLQLITTLTIKDAFFLPADHDFSQKEMHTKMVALISDWLSLRLKETLNK